ncbi:DUF5702 domain-containing protein [Eisenbergiella sp.]
MRKGYITVYLSLVTGILLSLLLTVIEGVRMHTIRTQTECVMDMAMDSALAEYHREMLEQYELFFIDMSYGGTSPAFSNTEEHIRNYMNMNFRPYELFDIPIGKDLTGLSAVGVDLQQAAIASDEKGAVLKKQVIMYMKDKWGLGFLEQAAVNAGLMQTEGFLGADVELRRNETEKQVKEAILNKEKQEDEDWEGKNVELPSDVVNEARGEGILKLAVENSASLSRVSIPKAALYTGRSNKMEGTGLPSGAEPPSGVSDTCLFLKYVMDKCGYYNQMKDGSSFSYQVEYILQGKGNDLDNLRGMANQILLVREAANVAYLFSDGQKKAEARGAALLITGVLGMPELEEPVTQLILFAWGYAESVKDLRMLFDGEKVPIIKDSGSWNTPFSQLLTFRGHLSEYPRGQTGLGYGDYLQAFLFLESQEKVTERLMDVMEADIRQTKGNSCFRIDGCMDAMTAEASVSSGYGYQYSIKRAYRYD